MKGKYRYAKVALISGNEQIFISHNLEELLGYRAPYRALYLDHCSSGIVIFDSICFKLSERPLHHFFFFFYFLAHLHSSSIEDRKQAVFILPFIFELCLSISPYLDSKLFWV